jgi:DHA1 family tetracycline resistance protein-like MFS transporter
MRKPSPVFIVFFTVFLDLLGFGIMIPLQPYVALEFGASASEIGWLLAIYSIMQFLFAPLWGRLSDHIGRRPIILVSLVGSTAGYILFAVADSLTGLFVSRIIAGMAAANISTAHAIIADVLPPEQRTSGMGKVGAAIGLGFVFGPAIGGLTAGESSYTFPFILAAVLSGIDFVLAWLMLPETRKPESVQQPRRRKFSLAMIRTALNLELIPYLLLISLLYYLAFAAMESTFALYGYEVFSMNAVQNGIILACIGLIMAFVQGGMVGRVSRKRGEQNVLIGGIFGVIVGLFCIGAAFSFSFFIFSAFVLAISAGFVTPNISSMISQFSPSDVQGGMMGLNQSMASLGRIFGPLVGTYIFEWWGPSYPFYLGAVLILLALLVAQLLRSDISEIKTREGISLES